MSSESGRYRRPVRPTGTGPAHGTVAGADDSEGTPALFRVITV